ncbi:MAG: hypothetical protein JO104_11820 [Candidatus Eremiobacteraeota bacterium]|nr:hypothetical protein [Candidatus Eremiobacteraeota bacterium]
MIRTLILGLFILAVSPQPAVAACAGPNPAITSVHVPYHNTKGQLNIYHIVGTVTNEGSSGQPSNVLQFVDIYQYGQKLDSRGIPPLAAGASYNFSYNWARSVEAAAGSSMMNFRMDMRSGINCNPANGTYSVMF